MTANDKIDIAQTALNHHSVALKPKMRETDDHVALLFVAEIISPPVSRFHRVTELKLSGNGCINHRPDISSKTYDPDLESGFADR